MNWKCYNPTFEYEKYYFDDCSPWGGHKLFVYDLVRNSKPKLIVELGTFKGTSLFSMAQAVKDELLETTLVAVDTWEGDIHSGFYNSIRIKSFVQKIIKECYLAQNIILQQKTFDIAAKDIEDNSIDILHIDGLHTYEAVKNDYKNWSNKVKKNGTILLHDTTNTTEGFGVKKFITELKKQETLNIHNFPHSYGLGVIFKNDVLFQDFISQNSNPNSYYLQKSYSKLKEQFSTYKRMTRGEFLENLQFLKIIKLLRKYMTNRKGQV